MNSPSCLSRLSRIQRMVRVHQIAVGHYTVPSTVAASWCIVSANSLWRTLVSSYWALAHSQGPLCCPGMLLIIGTVPKIAACSWSLLQNQYWLTSGTDASSAEEWAGWESTIFIRFC